MNPQSMFLSRNIKKYQTFLSENFQFLVVKFSVCYNRHVFVMSVKPAFSDCHTKISLNLKIAFKRNAHDIYNRKQAFAI